MKHLNMRVTGKIIFFWFKRCAWCQFLKTGWFSELYYGSGYLCAECSKASYYYVEGEEKMVMVPLTKEEEEIQRLKETLKECLEWFDSLLPSSIYRPSADDMIERIKKLI